MNTFPTPAPQGPALTADLIRQNENYAKWEAAREARLRQIEARRRLKRFTPGEDWQYSDGGQNDTGIFDTNNCTVRAYANATGARFVDADAAMELCGRKRNAGGSIYCSIGRVAKMLGFGWVKLETGALIRFKTVSHYGEEYLDSRWKRQTVHTFLKQNPTGRFVLTIRHHAFAVVDGKVVDSHRWSKLCRVDGAYRVTEARSEWAA